MARYKNNSLLRVGPDDGVDQYLENKVLPGANIAITYKQDKTYGKQMILSAVQGGGDPNNGVLEVNNNVVVPNTVTLVLVDASEQSVEVVLPHPAEVIGQLSIVCVGNEHGIAITPPEGASIYDTSNIDLNVSGDSLLFASNRRDTWYCVARYAANWYA